MLRMRGTRNFRMQHHINFGTLSWHCLAFRGMSPWGRVLCLVWNWVYCEVAKLEQSITKKRVGTEVGIRSIKTDDRAVLSIFRRHSVVLHVLGSRKRPPTSSPGNAICKHTVLNTFPVSSERKEILLPVIERIMLIGPELAERTKACCPSRLRFDTYYYLPSLLYRLFPPQLRKTVTHRTLPLPYPFHLTSLFCRRLEEAAANL